MLLIGAIALQGCNCSCLGPEMSLGGWDTGYAPPAETPPPPIEIQVSWHDDGLQPPAGCEDVLEVELDAPWWVDDGSVRVGMVHIDDFYVIPAEDCMTRVCHPMPEDGLIPQTSPCSELSSGGGWTRFDASDAPFLTYVVRHQQSCWTVGPNPEYYADLHCLHLD